MPDKISSPSGLLFYAWEAGNGSVFNPLSGETHLLNAFPVEILRICGDQSMTRRALLKQLVQATGTPEGELASHFANTLSQLESLELIRIQTESTAP